MVCFKLGKALRIWSSRSNMLPYSFVHHLVYLVRCVHGVWLMSCFVDRTIFLYNLVWLMTITKSACDFFFFFLCHFMNLCYVLLNKRALDLCLLGTATEQDITLNLKGSSAKLLMIYFQLECQASKTAAAFASSSSRLQCKLKKKSQQYF